MTGRAKSPVPAPTPPDGAPITAYDYTLPAASIAQHPVEPRDAARLLDATGPTVVHRHVRDLPGLVGPGDVIVVNDTRVLPARLGLRKRSGARAEVLLVGPVAAPAGDAGPGATWHALVRPGRRLPPGTVLVSGSGDEVLEVGARLDGGLRLVRLLVDPWRYGALALPPYIRDAPADPERYQTVYAAVPGSVAAPTAGLHLTEGVLDGCRARGAVVCRMQLDVGLDTFRPVAVDDPADHVMHSERYRVPPETWEACRGARRVVAIGTTTVRALESVAASGRFEGHTRLFIRPGFPLAVVDVLMTNFHLPRSTLLMMIEAVCGPRWRDLYGLAVEEGYRFLSFGDAMLLARQ